MKTTVTVKNKLGKKFGSRKIQVDTRANEETTSSLTILPWGEKMVHPIDPVPPKLDSIEIEALEEGNEIPIPIGITPTDDLNVEVDKVTGEDKWILTFTPPIIPTKTNGESNVNVTLGQDEPPNILLYLLVALLIGFLIGLMVGLSL